MRRDAPACRAAPSERGAGKSGSAAQNLPRFSSTATTVSADLPEDFPTDLPPEAFPDFPAALPEAFPVAFPDCPVILPEDFPVDLRGELT